MSDVFVMLGNSWFISANLLHSDFASSSETPDFASVVLEIREARSDQLGGYIGQAGTNGSTLGGFVVQVRGGSSRSIDRAPPPRSEANRIRRAVAIWRGRPEIGNRVFRVPQPRRPYTVLRDGRLHVEEQCHTLKGAAANNPIQRGDATHLGDYRRSGNAECGSPPSCPYAFAGRWRSFPADRHGALSTFPKRRGNAPPFGLWHSVTSIRQRLELALQIGAKPA
jgi:hypothetical protein